MNKPISGQGCCVLQDEVFCICHLHLCQFGLKNGILRPDMTQSQCLTSLWEFVSVGGWMSCRGPFQGHQVNDSARCRKYSSLSRKKRLW